MIKNGARKRLALLGLGLFLLSPSQPARALPTGESVVSGDVTFDQADPSTLNITASDGSIIEFNSFSIAAGETVNFYLPDADAFTLSRVTGGGASEIFGNLYANGNLVLVNTGGIHFGATADVNVAGLIASTQNITNADFAAGNYIFTGTDTNANSFISNEGYLTADEGGFIVLASDAISNTGVIEAPLGTVSLAGGTNITVAITGNGMVSVAIDEATAHTILDAEGRPITEQIANSGTLSGATVKMNAQSAAQVFQSSINQEGIIRATDVSVGEDGVVVIGGSGPVYSSGPITAKSITVSSGTDLYIEGSYDNLDNGSTTFQADNDIHVTGDLTVNSGNLALLADDDLNGEGSYVQDAGTTVKTTTSGDITIQASGESTLGNIVSAGSLILQKAGADVSFSQLSGTTVTSAGSITIGNGASYSAANAIITLVRDWINNGVFNAGTSTVKLDGPDISTVYGNNSFYNFEVIEPGKTVNFESGKTQEFTGALTLQGSTGQLLTIRSSNAELPANFSILGTYTIEFINLRNMTNILNHGPPAVVSESNFLNTQGFSANYSGSGLEVYTISGDNTFFNFTVTAPGQHLIFEADSMTTITGTLTVMGAPDNFVSFNSSIQSIDHMFGIYINAVSDGQGNAYLQNLEVRYSHAYGPEGMLPIQVRGEYIPFELNLNWDATFTWDGGGSDDYWTNALNWVGDTAPIGDGTDTIVLNADSINDYANGTTFAGITLNATGISLSGNDIVLGASGITDSSSSGSNTISLNISMTAVRGVNVANSDQTLTLSGVLSGTNGGIQKNGSGVLVLSNSSNSYTGRTQINAGVVSVAHVANGSNNSALGASTNIASNLFLNGGTLRYTGSGHSTDRLFAVGLTGGTIEANGSGTLNFTNAGTLTVSGSASRTLTLSGTGEASLATIVPNPASGGTISLTKNGAGTWTLTAANTYTGVTTINAGVLAVNTINDGGVAGGLGQATNAAGNLVIDGGTLRYLGSGESTDRIVSIGNSGGTIDNSGSGALTFSNTAAMDFNSETGTRTLTLTGSNTDANNFNLVIGDNTGATSLVKSGAGVWALGSTSNSFTGTTTVSAGTLRLSATGVMSSSSAVTVNGILDMMGQNHTLGSLAGSGTVTSGLAGPTVTLYAGSDNSSTTFSGVIQNGDGTVNVEKQGSGTWALTGSNTYTGTTTIIGGVLSVNTMADGGTASSIGASAATAANLVIDGATLRYTGTGHSSNRLFTISPNGATLDASGSGTLTLTGNGNIVQMPGPVRTLTLTGSGNGSLAGTMIDPAGGGVLNLTKSSAGTWTLTNGASTYTGVTTISGGVLSVSTLAAGGIASDIGASTNVAGNLILDGGTLRYTGGATATDRLFSLTGNGGTLDASGSGALSFNNGGAIVVTVASSPTLTLTGSNTDLNQLASTIADNTQTTNVTKSGAGTWELANAANTYTGVTTVSGGTLRVGTLANGGANSSIGASTNASTNLVLNGGGLLYMGGNVSTDRLFSVGTSGATITSSGGGSLIFSNAGEIGYNSQTGARTLTFGGTDNPVSFNPIIGDNTGATSLVKTGSGTWVLNATNTYTGSTTINGGTLSISADDRLGAAPGSPTAGHLTFNGGTLSITSDMTLNANRGIALTGAGTFDISGNTIIYNGIMTGAGSFTKSGMGNLTLGGSVTTGSFTVTAAAIGGDGLALLDINGTLTIQTTATLSVPVVNFYISGDLVIDNGGNLGVGAGGKIIFDGSGAQSFNITNLSNYHEIVHSGTGTLTLSGAGTLTLQAFTNSAGTFDLNGVNFAVQTGSFSNDGTFKLNGNETVTLTTPDTNSGTWYYEGRNVSETLTIKYFGANDYYNLTINDQNATKATFALGEDLVVNGTLTLGAGTISQSTYTITSAAYTQTGGTFTGGSANMTINGAAAISGSGAVMTLTTATTQVITMTITDPAVVRLQSGSTLTITGSGEALAGTGTLDTTTNGNNTVQFSGSGVLIPAGSPYYNLSLIPIGFSVNASGQITFNADEVGVSSAVVDTANGYAYIGTGTTPGFIIKVRLADMSRVGTITLSTGENNLTTAVIAGSFAYFGTNTAPGIVVKIDLTTFARHSAVTLNSGENYLYSAVVDEGNGFAYFGTNTAPAIVVKVDINTFGRTGALTLNSGENYIYNHSGVIDANNGFAYFGTNTDPGIIVKVNLSSFTRTGAVTGAAGESNFVSAAIDTTGVGYAYFGTYTSPGKVLKIDLSNFTKVDVETLNSGEEYLTAMVIDTTLRNLYVGTDTASGKVIKLDVNGATISRTSALTLNANEDYLYSAVIDAVGGYAYFGTVSSPSYFVKVKLSDLSRTSALSLNVAENFISSAVVDTAAGFAYFGTYVSPGVIVKVRLSDYARVGALTLNSGENILSSAVIDATNGYAYFGTYTAAGRVVKVRLSDFTRYAALTLNNGENYLTSAVIDTTGGFAYFGTYTAPGIVVKVQLSTLTRSGAVTFESGENNLATAVIDNTNKFAYFGTYTQPGIVVKVNTDPAGSFVRTAAVTLSSGEDNLSSSVIDVANNLAYFGTDTAPGKIVKVSTATGNFSRVSALTLNAGESFLRTAVIDTTTGYAYFATYTNPGIVVRVKLSDFSRDAIVTLSAGQRNLAASVINMTTKVMLVGSSEAPGRVYAILLGGEIYFGTAGSQTITVTNNLEIGALASAFASTYNPIIDVGGMFYIASGGSFTASGSSAFTVAGNWWNAGTFVANSGTVTLDGDSQSIQGTTTFYNLIKDETGKTNTSMLTFQAGSTTTVTGLLRLKGNATNRLQLRSSAGGNQFYLNGTGTTDLDRLNVQDSNAVTALTASNSLGVSNNTGWTFS